MVDVQFEENNQFNSGSGFQSRRVFGEPTTPGMIRFLMKIGIKDEKAAGYILWIIIVLFFAIAVIVFMMNVSREEKQKPGKYVEPITGRIIEVR